ncbi:MAG: hypothetical protein AMJ81_08720 [Phycisphaerae bacterium SM23_33]|nr:MAG: hypothetical protein AMJ81_08720 [Phycisphaerae bacterium SM23_33]
MSSDVRSEAIEFVRDHPTSHLATVEDNAPYTRIMQVFQVDDDFCIWYVSGASSNKVRQIRKCPKVCVSIWESGRDARVLGSAQVLTDERTRRQMWREEWKRFFPKGRDDPEYCLLKVTPETVEYRDVNKHGFTTQKVV